MMKHMIEESKAPLIYENIKHLPKTAGIAFNKLDFFNKPLPLFTLRLILSKCFDFM